MKIRENIYLYIVIVLTILFLASSYVRFIVNYDYIVTYESTCDPRMNSCFYECLDDGCTEKGFFSHIQKHAANLHTQCGSDITSCEKADLCLASEDEGCSITYCDPEIDGEVCVTTGEATEDNSTLESHI